MSLRVSAVQPVEVGVLPLAGLLSPSEEQAVRPAIATAIERTSNRIRAPRISTERPTPEMFPGFGSGPKLARHATRHPVRPTSRAHGRATPAATCAIACALQDASFRARDLRDARGH